MTHVSISGLVLALSLGCASLSHAQATPSGYTSLEGYSENVGSADGSPAIPEFKAERGASLRTTLELWAEQAGWQPLSWKLPEETDFTLGASHTFKGDFVSVTRAFVAALGPEAELRVAFNQGNLLMVVEPRK
jgi:hypothetical protein